MVYTPSVANMPRQIERTVQGLRKRVNALAVRAPQAIRAPQASTARLQRWYAAYHDWLLVMPFG